MKTKDRVYKMRTEDKMSYSNIAKKLGVSRATVMYHSKRLGTTGILTDKLTEEQLKLNAYSSLKEYRIRQKLRAVEYKGGSCCNCGYDKCSAALEFHHIDPSTKEFSFSKYSNHAWDKITKELDKCIMLCANCHREEHEKINMERNSVGKSAMLIP